MQAQYTQNSLSLPLSDSSATPPMLSLVTAAAAENNIAVVLGFSEKSPSSSVYISQCIISPSGQLVLHRRKIKATHMERTIFGDGSGRDLTNVVEIDFGSPVGKVKVGCLACWEHAQPLLKYHTIAQGEMIHVAMWPPIAPSSGPEDPMLWSMTTEGCQNLSQTYAIESAAYVLHVTGVCNEKGIAEMKSEAGLVCNKPGGGHSCVIGPDGRRLTTPLGDDGSGTNEGIVYADLDLTKSVAVKGFLDVVGHYSRPDLLWLGVDKKQKHVVVVKGDDSVE